MASKLGRYTTYKKLFKARLETSSCYKKERVDMNYTKVDKYHLSYKEKSINIFEFEVKAFYARLVFEIMKGYCVFFKWKLEATLDQN